MVYLDYAQTTPMSYEALDIYNKILKDYPGDLASNHKLGEKSKDLFKKTFSSVLLLTTLQTQISLASDFSGHIEKTDTNKTELNKELFTGEIEKLDGDDVINLTVSQVLSEGYTIEGDEFFAEVTSDVETDKGIIIPTGTIVHGIVKIIEEAKNMGRNGYINVDFDYMVTPDGREIPIEKLLSQDLQDMISVYRECMVQTNDVNNEIINRGMKTSDITLKRYTASKGKSLKWYEWVINPNTRESERVLRYAECTAVIDTNQLDGEVLEIPQEEYKE